MTFAELHAALTRLLGAKSWCLSVEAWANGVPSWRVWITGDPMGTDLRAHSAEVLLQEAESFTANGPSGEPLAQIGDAVLPPAPAPAAKADDDIDCPF